MHVICDLKRYAAPLLFTPYYLRRALFYLHRIIYAAPSTNRELHLTFPLPETLSVSTTEPAIQRRPVHPSRTQQPTEPDVVPDPKTVRFPYRYRCKYPFFDRLFLEIALV